MSYIYLRGNIFHFRYGIPKRYQHIFGKSDKLSRQLAVLDSASSPTDMNLPGWKLHGLLASMNEQWSVRVNGNWRLTFKFEEGDAVLVDYQDYH